MASSLHGVEPDDTPLAGERPTMFGATAGLSTRFSPCMRARASCPFAGRVQPMTTTPHDRDRLMGGDNARRSASARLSGASRPLPDGVVFPDVRKSRHQFDFVDAQLRVHDGESEPPDARGPVPRTRRGMLNWGFAPPSGRRGPRPSGSPRGRVYRLVRLVIDLLVLRGREDRSKDVEILVLRHQRVLRRQMALRASNPMTERSSPRSLAYSAVTAGRSWW
jgi:hypothetical protein